MTGVYDDHPTLPWGVKNACKTKQNQMAITQLSRVGERGATCLPKAIVGLKLDQNIKCPYR